MATRRRALGSRVVQRRLARLVVTAALVAGMTVAAVGCGGGATAGDGVTSPPSTSGS